MLLTLPSRHFCLLLQAKVVYQERSPINALGYFNKPIAFFQVRHCRGAAAGHGDTA
jgi:hypothetical protein